DRVRLTALAAGHPDPLTRLWLLRGLHAITEVILDGTARLAAEAESEPGSGAGLRLDFLAGRHLPAPPPTPGASGAAGDVLTEVFDQAEEHLDLALDVALSNAL